jgi:integrase
MKATINEALCRMAAPEKRTDYFDTKLTGFTFRTTPTGARSFWFVYRDKALKKPVWVPLGKYSDSFKSDEARTEAIKLQGDVRRGADPAKARREAISARVSGSVPFGVAVGEYLTEITGTHRAWAVVESLLVRPLEAWGNLPCSDITDDMAAALLRPLVKQGLGARANKIQTALHTFFQWCRQPGRKYVKANPLAGVASFGGKRRKSRDRDLTEDEIRTLWHGLDNPDVLAQAHCMRHRALALKLTLVTMLRSGEVVKGHSRELGDFDGPPWTIPAARVKLKRDIVQPLNTLARGIIDELLTGSNSGVMFPGDGKDGMMSQQSLGQLLRGTKRAPALFKVLGMAKFTPHDLRRTGATLCNKHGRHIPNIAADVDLTMDHKKTSGVSAAYNRHDGLAEKRVVLDLLDRELRRIIGMPAVAPVPFKLVA